MEQILASTGSQEEIASRVTALLEGTALSGNRGEDTFVGDDGSKLTKTETTKTFFFFSFLLLSFQNQLKS